MVSGSWAGTSPSEPSPPAVPHCGHSECFSEIQTGSSYGPWAFMAKDEPLGCNQCSGARPACCLCNPISCPCPLPLRSSCRADRILSDLLLLLPDHLSLPLLPHLSTCYLFFRLTLGVSPLEASLVRPLMAACLTGLQELVLPSPFLGTRL